jgi:phosphate transport system substrate-binding protein
MLLRCIRSRTHEATPMQRFSVLLAAVLALGTTATTNAQLRLHGSNTIGEELAPALVRGWLEQRGYDDIRIEQQAPLERRLIASDGAGESIWVQIHAHGSSTSFRDLEAGAADMGMASRRIRDAEVEQLAFLGRLDTPRHEFVIGIDGLAVIVHPDNPISALDVGRIRDLFAGRIDNWRELGGPDRAVTLYARGEKSGTWDSFESMVLQGTPLDDAARRFESSSRLSDLVADDPGAIGFIGLPYVRDAKALRVAAGDTPVSPDRFSSATEDYPLSRRLYMYVPDRELGGLGGALAEFAISPAGQRIVDEIGFVGQDIDVRRVELPESAPRDYRRFVDGALRASMNFRFDAGRPELDSKSRRDLDRLVRFLRDPATRDYEVLLMGFADPSETMKYFSLALSNDRVDYVATLLLQRDIAVHRVRGFGDALLLAEGTGPISRVKNRRVEVWLKPADGATGAAGAP